MSNINKFLIAGGNSTALIKGKSFAAKKILALLDEVEQVGFTKSGRVPSLTMMGNELSINGTLAFASTLKSTGYLKTSGIATKIKYENTKDFTTIQIPINFKRQANYVFLQGIGFLISNTKIKNLKKILDELCTKYKYPAFGKIEYSQSQITPYVFVKKTQSLVKETACGSGSLSFFIVNGIGKVRQPTGKVIQISSDESTFYISAKVTKIE